MQYSQMLEGLIEQYLPEPIYLSPEQLTQLIIYRHQSASHSYLGGDHSKERLNELAQKEAKKLSPVTLQWSFVSVDKNIILYTSELTSPRIFEGEDVQDSLDGLNQAWILLQGTDFFQQLEESTIVVGDPLHLVLCLESEYVYS